MKLSTIQLYNFRCFKDIRLDLHDRVTLLVGRNMSGKTAMLDALAIALGGWFSGTSTARLEGRNIHHDDARLVRQEEGGLPTLNPSYPVCVNMRGEVDGEPISWTRELLHHRGRTTRVKSKTIRRLAARMESAATANSTATLPLLAYYGTGRLWVQKSDKRPQRLGSRMQGYAACLETASNTKLFQRWMAWRESDRLQRIATAEEHGAATSTVTTPHMDAVVRAAQSCLEDVRRLFYSANHSELRLEFEDGRLLPFERLSDGLKSLVVLAADLAWRAAQLNPHHGSHAPQETPGVVLIDEIELHLHPAWQRRVIDNLVRTFPRVQFVITTHSPQVVATAHSDWIRVLREDGVGRVGHVRGRDSNAILREVMGVPERPSWMEEKLATLERQIESGELEAAREQLELVRADVGSSDHALLALEWELHDQEAAG